jgi:hypothetical protein
LDAGTRRGGPGNAMVRKSTHCQGRVMAAASRSPTLSARDSRRSLARSVAIRVLSAMAGSREWYPSASDREDRWTDLVRAIEFSGMSTRPPNAHIRCDC